MLAAKRDIFLHNGQVDPALFTPPAWKSLEDGLLAGQQTHWETIRSPHLFMGLLSAPDRTVREWGYQLGADIPRLLRQFRQLFKQDDSTLAPLRLHREFLSQNAIEVLRAAHGRMRDQGRMKITPADILWAVLANDSCVTACFAESGIAAPVLRVLLSEAERHAAASSDLSQSL